MAGRLQPWLQNGGKRKHVVSRLIAVTKFFYKAKLLNGDQFVGLHESVNGVGEVLANDKKVLTLERKSIPHEVRFAQSTQRTAYSILRTTAHAQQAGISLLQ